MESSRVTIGWREWVCLPDLDIAHIKAKVDTGARTSALHAFSVKPFHDRGAPMLRFSVHPLQKQTEPMVECVAPVADRRWVSDSGGHRERRYVVVTAVVLAGQRWEIEMTLTNRDTMRFRMLLGRTALRGRYLVDSGRSYLVGPPPHENA